MHTISTSLERTLDINGASMSKAPRNDFILPIEVLQQTGRELQIARVYVSSSSGISIDWLGRDNCRSLVRCSAEHDSAKAAALRLGVLKLHHAQRASYLRTHGK